VRFLVFAHAQGQLTFVGTYWDNFKDLGQVCSKSATFEATDWNFKNPGSEDSDVSESNPNRLGQPLVTMEYTSKDVHKSGTIA
jgi:hypothetical protein